MIRGCKLKLYFFLVIHWETEYSFFFFLGKPGIFKSIVSLYRLYISRNGADLGLVLRLVISIKLWSSLTCRRKVACLLVLSH